MSTPTFQAVTTREKPNRRETFATGGKSLAILFVFICLICCDADPTVSFGVQLLRIVDVVGDAATKYVSFFVECVFF
jgi:hypothetical protein